MFPAVPPARIHLVKPSTPLTAAQRAEETRDIMETMGLSRFAALRLVHEMGR